MYERGVGGVRIVLPRSVQLARACVSECVGMCMRGGKGGGG